MKNLSILLVLASFLVLFLNSCTKKEVKEELPQISNHELLLIDKGDVETPITKE